MISIGDLLGAERGRWIEEFIDELVNGIVGNETEINEKKSKSSQLGSLKPAVTDRQSKFNKIKFFISKILIFSKLEKSSARAERSDDSSAKDIASVSTLDPSLRPSAVWILRQLKSMNWSQSVPEKTGTLRDPKTEKTLIERGVSGTLKSLHITGKAFDVMPMNPVVKGAYLKTGTPEYQQEMRSLWVKVRDNPDKINEIKDNGEKKFLHYLFDFTKLVVAQNEKLKSENLELETGEDWNAPWDPFHVQIQTMAEGEARRKKGIGMHYKKVAASSSVSLPKLPLSYTTHPELPGEKSRKKMASQGESADRTDASLGVGRATKPMPANDDYLATAAIFTPLEG